ncbi:Kelch repeat-containing protein [Anaeromyxobacter paludicola]|uniref:Kelch repeat-containing protein n=1 Tax=Anaeromyxobacter paludicola TaxID=2918171 RepID=A0ABM7X6F1_9BACT|nr:kelch repeat-containing protein [Anaeromyxobacter paludicola]BDG07393.1 hypothetical protein AMPC_05060 [Anaeromyxobacter paludicola]
MTFSSSRTHGLRSRSALLVLSGALALLAAGCGDTTQDGVIAVTARLSGLSDHSGIALTITGPATASGITTVSGQRAFTSLPPGSYEVRAVAPSTTEGSLTATAVVLAGYASQVQLDFTPAGTLSGVVALGDGASPTAVQVRVAGTRLAATPDASGSWSITGVPAGARSVVASATGYDDATTGVAVTYKAQATVPTLTLAKQVIPPTPTAPGLTLSAFQIVRKPLGENDAVRAAAGGVTAPQGATVYFRDGSGTLLAQATPAADGSVPETPLPGSDGASASRFAPKEVYASVSAASFAETAPAVIGAGRDVAGPLGNGALVGFQRNDVQTPDQLAGQAGAFTDASAIAIFRIYASDAGGAPLFEATPGADGGFGPHDVTPVGAPVPAPARLWVAAVDKCGNEGAPVEALVGRALSGPVADGARLHLRRNDLTAPDAVFGDAGAFSSTCALTGVHVTDAAGALLGATAAEADGGFLDVQVGTATRSVPRAFAAGSDKCGLVGAAVEALDGRDETPPAIDPALLVFQLRPAGTPDGLSGDSGAVRDAVSAVAQVTVRRDGPSGAVLAQGFALGLDGGFAEQALGDTSLDHVWVEAVDKAGNAAAAVASRAVQTAVTLGGRAPHAPLAPLTGALYAFSAPSDPRLASPALALQLGDEVAAQDLAAAAAPDGATAHLSASPVSAAGTGWRRLSGGPRAWPGVALGLPPGATAPTLFAFGGDDGPISPPGLDELLTFDGTRWSRASPPASPSPRWGAALAYDEKAQKLVLFGGQAADGSALGDTWIYDGLTWAQVPTITAPPPRIMTGLLWWGLPGPEQLVLYGGRDAAGNTFDDTWTFDTASQTWTQATPAGSPGARAGAALAYDSARNQVLLFGGNDASGNDLADTWRFDGASWTQLAPPQSPAARSFAAMAFDSARGVAVMVGGAPVPSVGLETWQFDGVSWSPGVPLPTDPVYVGARAEASLVYDPFSARTLLVGGDRYDGPGATLLVAAYDGASWTALAGALPPARVRAPMAFDAARGALLVHGDGEDPYPTSADTWTFGPGGWTSRTGPQDPALAQAPLAYDAARAVTVLFGCEPGQPAQCGTWEWDGSGFTHVTSAHQPPARLGHALAFDPSRGRTVLFGGADPSSGAPLDDTWSWDGADWTELLSAQRPPARATAALAFDGRAGQLVLFGGTPDGQAGLADTWTLGESGWSQADAAAPPPACAAPALAFDALRGVLVLHDGLGGLFERDGSAPAPAWTPVTDPVAPVLPREAVALAFDQVDGGVALLGGTDGFTYGDLWVYDRRAPSSVFAAHLATFAVDPAATVVSASVTWVGAGSGDGGAGPAYGAELLAWDWTGRAWAPLGANGTAVPGAIPASLPGAAARFFSGGRLSLLAVPTVPSSSPGGTQASDIWTDFVQAQVRYLLP